MPSHILVCEQTECLFLDFVFSFHEFPEIWRLLNLFLNFPEFIVHFYLLSWNMTTFVHPLKSSIEYMHFHIITFERIFSQIKMKQIVDGEHQISQTSIYVRMPYSRLNIYDGEYLDANKRKKGGNMDCAEDIQQQIHIIQLYLRVELRKWLFVRANGREEYGESI